MRTIWISDLSGSNLALPRVTKHPCSCVCERVSVYICVSHTHTRARTHTRTHAYTHVDTQVYTFSIFRIHLARTQRTRFCQRLLVLISGSAIVSASATFYKLTYFITVQVRDCCACACDLNAQTQTCALVRMRMHVYVSKYTHILTHLQGCTHTHTHTHRQVCGWDSCLCIYLSSRATMLWRIHQASW